MCSCPSWHIFVIGRSHPSRDSSKKGSCPREKGSIQVLYSGQQIVLKVKYIICMPFSIYLQLL